MKIIQIIKQELRKGKSRWDSSHIYLRKTPTIEWRHTVPTMHWAPLLNAAGFKGWCSCARLSLDSVSEDDLVYLQIPLESCWGWFWDNPRRGPSFFFKKEALYRGTRFLGNQNHKHGCHFQPFLPALLRWCALSRVESPSSQRENWETW